ncbi:MAG: hypothetical protein ACK4Q5_18880 [Saprospiraceae bacterium]
MKRIFQQTVVCLLAAAILAQSGVKTAITVYFYLNRANIAQNLCEKRFEENSCCQGSCQVSKWLKADESSPEKAPAAPNLSKIEEPQIFCNALPTFLFRAAAPLPKLDCPPYLAHRPAAPGRDFFHPPSC